MTKFLDVEFARDGGLRSPFATGSWRAGGPLGLLGAVVAVAGCGRPDSVGAARVSTNEGAPSAVRDEVKTDQARGVSYTPSQQAIRDLDSDTLRFSAELSTGASLDSVGLIFNENTGEISGTYTGTGTIEIRITAVDANDARAAVDLIVKKADGGDVAGSPTDATGVGTDASSPGAGETEGSGTTPGTAGLADDGGSDATPGSSAGTGVLPPRSEETEGSGAEPGIAVPAPADGGGSDAAPGSSTGDERDARGRVDGDHLDYILAHGWTHVGGDGLPRRVAQVGVMGRDGIRKGFTDIEEIRFNDISFKIVETPTSDNDLLTGTYDPETIYGLDGDDRIVGLGGVDILIGGAGSDTFVGGLGNDEIYGHSLDSEGPDSDIDTAFYRGNRSDYEIAKEVVDNINRVVVEHDAEDALAEGRDILYGIERIRFNDEIVLVWELFESDEKPVDANGETEEGDGAGSGDTGGKINEAPITDPINVGNPTHGGTPVVPIAPPVEPTPNTDDAVFRQNFSEYRISPGGESNMIVVEHIDSSNSSDGRTVSNVENLRFNDRVIPVSTTMVNGVALILGTDGDDDMNDADINGYSGNIAGEFTYIFGYGGNDEIVVRRDNTIIYGGDGDDAIYARRDNNEINGGDGDDILIGGFGNDTIDGGDGNDSIYGSLGNNTINGGGGNDDIYGRAGNETVVYAGVRSEYRYESGYIIDMDVEDVDEGRDYLHEVEWIQFADQRVSFTEWRSGEQAASAPDESDSELTEIFRHNFNEYRVSPRDQWNTIEVKYIGSIRHADSRNVPNAGDVYNLQFNDRTIPITTTMVDGLALVLGTDGNDGINNDFMDDTNLEGTMGQENMMEESIYIFGYDGDDEIGGRGGEDRLFGGEGDDIIHGGDGDDRVYGGEGRDEIHGGGGNDVIEGGWGGDTLYGGAGDDTIDGGNYHDEIRGGAGNDEIRGGAGNDEIRGGAGNDVIQGGSYDDALYGDAGDDELYGGNNVDEIHGGAGNDVIEGGSGKDTLYGGMGDDTIDGGPDVDTVFYAGVRADYRHENGDIIDMNMEDMDEGRDTLRGIEWIQFSDHKISFSGWSSGIDLVLYALAEGTGNASINDVLNGTDNDDIIHAYAGDDVINGLDGNDVLFGDSDYDRINGGGGDDSIFGGPGNDILNGGDGDDKLYGSTGNDVVDGGEGVDTVEYSEDRDEYKIVRNADSTIIVIDIAMRYTATGDRINTEGSDTLTNIEILRFADDENVSGRIDIRLEDLIFDADASVPRVIPDAGLVAGNTAGRDIIYGGADYYSGVDYKDLDSNSLNTRSDYIVEKVEVRTDTGRVEFILVTEKANPENYDITWDVNLLSFDLNTVHSYSVKTSDYGGFDDHYETSANDLFNGDAMEGEDGYYPDFGKHNDETILNLVGNGSQYEIKRLPIDEVDVFIVDDIGPNGGGRDIVWNVDVIAFNDKMVRLTAPVELDNALDVSANATNDYVTDTLF